MYNTEDMLSFLRKKLVKASVLASPNNNEEAEMYRDLILVIEEYQQNQSLSD